MFMTCQKLNDTISIRFVFKTQIKSLYSVITKLCLNDSSRDKRNVRGYEILPLRNKHK